jgi:hypothetical protein
MCAQAKVTLRRVADLPVSLTTRFEHVLKEVEEGLRVSLKKARAETGHPGKKGTKVEIAARNVLREYMPPNLSIGDGGVYDSCGDEFGCGVAVAATYEVRCAAATSPLTAVDVIDRGVSERRGREVVRRYS